ncbi:glycosyltransferase family 4 protein [Candidatus Omnitrophota bacterium]
MKFLLITEQFPPLVGGAAFHLYNLYSRMGSHEVAVYTMKRPGSEEFDKKQKIKISRHWIWEKSFSLLHPTSIIGPFWLLCGVIRQIFKQKPDILHCGTVHPSGECALIIKKFFGMPYIVYTFAEEIGHFNRSRLKRFIIAKVLRNAEAVISICDYTVNMLVGLGVEREKIFKIPPGVDLKEFRADKDAVTKEQLGLEGKVVLLTVARLAERKNHQVVLRALPRVLEEFPNCAYVITGSGPTEKKLRMLIEELGLKQQVIFTGEIPLGEIHNYYNLADIFIMVNREIPERGDVEGFALVFLEAAAFKKPVIGGRSGGVIESVEDGSTGILINDPLDPDEVAAAILKLLRDKELAATMGKRARARVEKSFGWDKFKDKIIALNENIMASRKRDAPQ